MRFVQIQIMRRGQSLGFGQNASIPFDYPIISWVMNYVRNRGFLTCLSWFYRIWRSRTPRCYYISLQLKYIFISEFLKLFDKIPVRICLDVLFKTSSPSWHWAVWKVAVAILWFHIWNYKLILKMFC